MSEKYLYVKEVSKILGIHRTTLLRWDKKGIFRAFRHPVNNWRMYKLSEVYAFLNKIRKDDHGI